MSTISSVDRCAKCGGTTALRRCSRCLLVCYCSSQCQKLHWIAGHKSVCRDPSVLNTRAAIPIGGGSGGAAGSPNDSATKGAAAQAPLAALLAASESWSTKFSSPVVRKRRIGNGGNGGGAAGAEDSKQSGIAPIATAAAAAGDRSASPADDGRSASPAPFVLTSAGAAPFVGSPLERNAPSGRSPASSSRRLEGSSRSPVTTTRRIGGGDGTASPASATRSLGAGMSPASATRTLGLSGKGGAGAADGKSPALGSRTLLNRALGGAFTRAGSITKGGKEPEAPNTPSSAASAAAANAGAPISVGTPQPRRVTTGAHDSAASSAMSNPFVTDWMEVRSMGGELGNGWVARKDIPACTPLMIEFGVSSSAFPADSEYLENKAKDEIAFKLLRARRAATTAVDREVFNLSYFKYLKTSAKPAAAAAATTTTTGADTKSEPAAAAAASGSPTSSMKAALSRAASSAGLDSDKKSAPAAAGGDAAAAPVPAIRTESKDGANGSSDVKVLAGGEFDLDDTADIEPEASAESVAALEGIQRYKSPFPALCDDVRWSMMKARVRTNVWAHDLPIEQRASFPALSMEKKSSPSGDSKQRVLVVYPLVSRFNHSCAPNVALLVNPTLVTSGLIFALENIKAGTELCLSYSDTALLLPPEARRANLKSEHDFECACGRCNATGNGGRVHPSDVELEKIVTATHRTETPIMEREYVLVCEMAAAFGVSTQHSIRAIQHLLSWRQTWSTAFGSNHWRNVTIRGQLFDVFVGLKKSLPPNETLPAKLLATALDIAIEQLRSLRDLYPQFFPRKRQYWLAAMEFGQSFVKRISADEPELYRHYLQLLAVWTKMEKPFRVGSAVPAVGTPVIGLTAAGGGLAVSASATSTVLVSPTAAVATLPTPSPPTSDGGSAPNSAGASATASDAKSPSPTAHVPNMQLASATPIGGGGAGAKP